MSIAWRRVTREKPCPVCGRPDWCTTTLDGSAAGCMRTQSPKPMANGGWRHKLHDSEAWRERHYCRRIPVAASTPAPIDFATLAERYRQAVNPAALEQHAAELGVAPSALRRLDIGWDGESWIFPMRDATEAVVGIRRRFAGGRKLSVKGGREGAFIPRDLSRDGWLCVTEGVTDCAALLGLSFAAVGRPSCSGGVRCICDLARGRDVVIFADGDTPGRLGAEALALVLSLFCPSVRVIRPPAGTKDVREWVRRGATSADVQRVIDAAVPVRFIVSTNTAYRSRRGVGRG